MNLLNSFVFRQSQRKTNQNAVLVLYLLGLIALMTIISIASVCCAQSGREFMNNRNVNIGEASELAACHAMATGSQ